MQSQANINPSTAGCCQVGTRLVAGGLLGPHSSARPRYVGGLRLHLLAPLDGVKWASEAPVVMSNRRPRQQSGVFGRAPGRPA